MALRLVNNGRVKATMAASGGGVELNRTDLQHASDVSGRHVYGGGPFVRHDDFSS